MQKRQQLLGQLVKMGYEKNYQVEAPDSSQSVAVLLIFFDLTRENPIRIELWG